MKKIKLIIINGPNLNLLGQREPEVYGSANFDTFLEGLMKRFNDIQIHYYQSNVEGEIINALHDSQKKYDGVILNAGGYTHTSVSIADAIASISTPVIEVHISNIFDREDFRNKSLISPNVIGTISGLGLKGYALAIESFLID